MKTTFRHLLAVLVLLGMTGALAACNTVAGAGKDVSATGDAVTGTAKKVQQGL
jgi:predicted small secreted protein